MGRLTDLVLFGVGFLVAYNGVSVARLRRTADNHDRSLDLDGLIGDGDAPPLRLVVLGDSYPAGFGLTDPDKTYPHQVARRMVEQAGRPVRVVSRAARGARIEDITRHQVPGLDELAPDVVAVIVGGNDALGRRTPTQVYRDTVVMIETIRAAAPKAQVVLGRTADLGDAPALPWPLSLLVSVACDWTARAQAGAADAFGVPHGRLPRQAPEMFGPDRFHGSALSHALAADLTLDVLEIFSDVRSSSS